MDITVQSTLTLIKNKEINIWLINKNQNIFQILKLKGEQEKVY